MIQPYHRPDAQELAMRRLMHLVSDEQRQDPQLEAKLRLYLKIGGEKLARQYLESVQLAFAEPFEIVRRRLDDGEIEESETSDSDGGEDVEDEDK